MALPRTKAGSNAKHQQKSSPAELVDALNALFGPQTHGRAVHAKGIVLTGSFLPGPAAATLSRAPHFQEPVSLTARFSNFTGNTEISDIDPMANPRGLSLKFHLPDGSETDLVTHSFNGFPAATADEFREFLIALATSGPDTPTPTPADLFFAAHPVAKHFLEHQQPAPVSFATLAYFGVNSFEFTNDQGDATIGRYRIAPEAGIHFLSDDQRANAEPNYLSAEIRRRIAREPVRFEFRVQIAESSDQIENPSIAWPDSRKTVDLGTIEMTRAVEDSESAQRTLLFLPGVLPEGIAAADPMIRARNDSYPISYDRRH